MHRASKVLLLALVLFESFIAVRISHAQCANLPAISFATVDEGRAILVTRDYFVSRLSPFDRSARMKTDRDVSEDEYLAFVGKNVLEWTPKEKAAVQAAWNTLAPKLGDFSLPFPKTIIFIKTTGDEEGHAEYTRANAIILPQDALAPTKRNSLRGLIAHESFHVLSRNASRSARPPLYRDWL
jgi:hypothetical protein